MKSSLSALGQLFQTRKPFVLSLSKDERIRPSGSRFDRLSTNGKAGIHGSDKVGLGFGLWVVAAIACAGGPPPPAQLDTRNESCRFCRMAVSTQRFAAQLVAPSEEAMFFDDIGCLRDFLKQQRSLSPGTMAYVADHRTGDWVAAAEALYTQSPGVATPMNSGLIAHRDEASRGQDQAARGGTRVPVGEILGPLAAGAGR